MTNRTWRWYQKETLITHEGYIREKDQSNMTSHTCRLYQGEKISPAWPVTREAYIRKKDQSSMTSHTWSLYQGKGSVQRDQSHMKVISERKISPAWPVTHEGYIREKGQSSMTSHTWRLYQIERSIQCDQSRIHIIPGWNTSHQVTCWRNKLIEVQYTRPIPNNQKWPNMKY